MEIIHSVQAGVAQEVEEVEKGLQWLIAMCLKNQDFRNWVHRESQSPFFQAPA